MNLGLKDRVALVAASSQGIGRATAEAFAAEGCRVAMCARNQQILQTVAEQIRKQHNVDVLAEAFDVTDAAAVSHFVVAVGKNSEASISAPPMPEARLPKGFLPRPREWPRALELNFLSSVYFARSDPADAEEALGPHHHTHIHATPSAIFAKSQPVRRMNPQPVPSIDENSDSAETPST
jgi:NAD(P)-dependent dehydrogenase (short-subunit alcohol dehydrogenase family)